MEGKNANGGSHPSRSRGAVAVKKRGEHVVTAPDLSIRKLYGCNVFGDEAMQKFMGKSDYLAVKECVNNNRRLDFQLADRVAEGMRRWAVEKGIFAVCSLFS